MKTPVPENLMFSNSKGYQIFTQMKHFHNKFERFCCIRKIRAKILTSYEHRYLNYESEGKSENAKLLFYSCDFKGDDGFPLYFT